MADQDKIGTHWSDDELDAIVADYFSMLSAELGGKPYVKAHHNAALMALIGRTHRSIEFKHQNIPAVLEELGLPWIQGYKPKRNYQSAIFDGIDRYLSSHKGILYQAPRRPIPAKEQKDIFVERPALLEKVDQPPRLERLVRKFDPVERDRLNRSLGKAGEEFVLELERQNLIIARRSDLASKVRWVSVEEGDGAGFDILSFDLTGHERLTPRMAAQERHSF